MKENENIEDSLMLRKFRNLDNEELEDLDIEEDEDDIRR